MARWAWGRGKEFLKPPRSTDMVEVVGTRLYDGSVEVRDYVVFVDEEAGIYKALTLEAGERFPSMRWKIVNGDIPLRTVRARVGFKVFVVPPVDLPETHKRITS